MYFPHPSKKLQDLFSAKPYQGVAPDKAMFLFVGLDANYKPSLETDSIFSKVVEYHEDGVAFWEKYDVHHPFLLPGYQGDGKKFHQRFAKIGFKQEHANLISFIELVEFPTTGRSRLQIGDLNKTHLDRLRGWIWGGSASFIFVPSGVAKILRSTGYFPEIPSKPVGNFGEFRILFKDSDRQVFQHLHFSNFGKFEQRLQKEASDIRRLIATAK